MDEERLASLRSFVAIELTESLRRALVERSEMLSSGIASRAIRWVRPQGIHLTLKFLGDVNAAELEKVQQVMLETVPRFSAFAFSVEGLGCFPSIQRPRIIWVGVRERSGEMAALHSGLEQAFAEHGFERENRQFNPHLTIGRIRRGVSKVDCRAVGEALGGVEHFSLGEVQVKEICLYRSELKPSGAVHTKLLTAHLEGGA